MCHLALLISIFLFLSCSQPAPRVVNVPAWSKGAVWYQIFPERFHNGDTSNDPTAEDSGIANYPNWQISLWTSDWYELQLWERARSSNFYESVFARRYGGDVQGMIDRLDYLATLRDLAIVYKAQGNLEQALQLLAVVLNHPASDQNSLNRPERLRDEAEKLRAQIESQLDPSLYQSAWESGQRQRLTEVVAQILN